MASYPWFARLTLLAPLTLGLAHCGQATSEDAGDGNSGGAASGGTAPDGGRSTADGGKKGSGGAGAQPGGGGIGGGGKPNGGSAGSGGSPGSGGEGGQGGANSLCELPFVAGPCEAAFPVYFYDASVGACRSAVYGGCGGNENRFDTLAECEQTCGVVRTGVSCEVNGTAYPDGSSGVPDPFSCNTCSCDDGQLTGCTENDCPEACPPDRAPGTDCAECGPTDACLMVRHSCLYVCGPNDECPNGGWCSDGVCRLGICG